MARAQPTITKLGADGSDRISTGLETYRRTNQGYRALKDRNIVLVVDDDPAVLKGVQRLLRAHAYEPILFSSAEVKSTPS
jgi:hypothetical protein